MQRAYSPLGATTYTGSGSVRVAPVSRSTMVEPKSAYASLAAKLRVLKITLDGVFSSHCNWQPIWKFQVVVSPMAWKRSPSAMSK